MSLFIHLQIFFIQHSRDTWRSFYHMTSFHRIIPVISIFNYCSWRVAMFNLQWTAWASSSWLHDDRNRMMFIECGFEISSAGLHKARFPIKMTFFQKANFCLILKICLFLRKFIVDVRDHVTNMFVKTNSHVRSNWSEYANLFVSVRIGSYLFGSVQICTNRVYSVVNGTLSDNQFGIGRFFSYQPIRSQINRI